jgi:hypothetical protein
MLAEVDWDSINKALLKSHIINMYQPIKTNVQSVADKF